MTTIYKSPSSVYHCSVCRQPLRAGKEETEGICSTCKGEYEALDEQCKEEIHGQKV